MTCECAHTQIHILGNNLHMSVHMSVYTSVHMSVYMSVHMSVHMSVYMSIHMLMQTPVDMSSHMSIGTYLHRAILNRFAATTTPATVLKRARPATFQQSEHCSRCSDLVVQHLTSCSILVILQLGLPPFWDEADMRLR